MRCRLLVVFVVAKLLLRATRVYEDRVYRNDVVLLYFKRLFRFYQFAAGLSYISVAPKPRGNERCRLSGIHGATSTQDNELN